MWGQRQARATSSEGGARAGPPPIWRHGSGDLAGALDLASSSSPQRAQQPPAVRRNSLDSTTPTIPRLGLPTLAEAAEALLEQQRSSAHAAALSKTDTDGAASVESGELLLPSKGSHAHEETGGSEWGGASRAGSGAGSADILAGGLIRSPSNSSLGEAFSKLSPGLLKLTSEEAMVFQGVFEDVDALRREVRNGQVLCGLTEQPPAYLPPEGHRELLALLWDNAARKGKGKGTTSPAVPPPAKADELCATPMWSSRVLHRSGGAGGDDATLQQLTGAAHMKLPIKGHKPVSATFKLNAAQLPSLLQSAMDGGGGGVVDPSTDVCVLRLSNMNVTGLPHRQVHQ